MQIRVVKAFRHGVDSVQLNQASSNPNIQVRYFIYFKGIFFFGGGEGLHNLTNSQLVHQRLLSRPIFLKIGCKVGLYWAVSRVKLLLHNYQL